MASRWHHDRRHHSTPFRRHPCLVVLVVGAMATFVVRAQQGVVIEVGSAGPFFDIDEAPPMGLRDVASVFPFAGPFAPGDGAPGDRFLHEALDGVDRGFLEQLVPVLQSRFQARSHPCDRDVARLCPHSDAPLHCLGQSRGTISVACAQEIKHAVPFVCSDQIQDFCSDDIEKGVLACLQEHGPRLGADCTDAIVAAKHAISSLASSQKKADAAMQGKRKKPAPHPKHAGACPPGWAGPEAGGCCTKRWSPSCAATCSSNQCKAVGKDWEFQWLDFRIHPYTCCPRPKPKSKEYIGGQPICPVGWALEPKNAAKAEGMCCRRPWSWDCGHDCAQSRCVVHPGFVWAHIDEGKEHYRCCPHGHGPKLPASSAHDNAHDHTGAKSSSKKGAAVKAAQVTASPVSPNADIPDGLGSSWVGKPIDLSSSGWTTGAFVVGIVALILFARRQMSQPQYGYPGKRA
jgi:hypothetical protein